jgi:hypothetical protein
LGRHHLLGAEHVVGIAHQQATAHVIHVQDHGHALGGFVGVAALGFGDEVCVRNAARFQVVASHLAFAEMRIVARAAGGDDDRRQSSLKQAVGMVQAGPVDGRRMADVFGRTEDDNGIGGVLFVDSSLAHDLTADEKQEPHRADSNQHDNPADGVRLGFPCGRGDLLLP